MLFWIIMDLKIANASVDSVKITHKKPPLYAVPAGTEIALFKLEEWEKIEKEDKTPKGLGMYIAKNVAAFYDIGVRYKSQLLDNRLCLHIFTLVFPKTIIQRS